MQEPKFSLEESKGAQKKCKNKKVPDLDSIKIEIIKAVAKGNHHCFFECEKTKESTENRYIPIRMKNCQSSVPTNTPIK